jgi:hypothetical protein
MDETRTKRNELEKLCGRVKLRLGSESGPEPARLALAVVRVRHHGASGGVEPAPSRPAISGCGPDELGRMPLRVILTGKR